MRRKGGIAGRVVDAVTKQPVTCFSVRMVPAEGRTGERFFGDFGYVSTWREAGHQIQSADGTWLIDDDDNLQPGCVQGVEVRADGYAAARIPRVVISTEPDPKANIVELVRGSVVSGTAVTTRGHAVNHAAISVLNEHQLSLMTMGEQKPGRDAETADSGAFTLKGVTPGEFHLYVRSEDAPPYCAGPFRVAPGQSLTDLHIVVPGACTVTGIVLDPQGSAIGGARVRVEPNPRVAGFDPAVVVAGSDGRFKVSGVPAGTHRVGYVDGEPMHPAIVRCITLQPDETKDVRLAFDGPCMVRVFIEGALVSPGAGFRISARPVQPKTGGITDGLRIERNVVLRGTTGEVTGLDTGDYAVSIQQLAIGGAVTTFGGDSTVTLSAGTPADVKFKMRAFHPPPLTPIR